MGGDDDDVLKWLLLAYPDRVVKRRGASNGPGVMVGGRGVRLGPESVVEDAELYLALDAREDRRGGAAGGPGQAGEHGQDSSGSRSFFRSHLRRERHDSLRRITAPRYRLRYQLWYHDLLLREDVECARSIPTEAGLILAEALRPVAASLIFRDNLQAALWLARLDFVRQALPELDWTAIS